MFVLPLLFIITINVPVVYMERYVMVLRRATSLRGALEGVGPENLGPKKLRFSGPTPSNAPSNDVAHLKTIKYKVTWMRVGSIQPSLATAFSIRSSRPISWKGNTFFLSSSLSDMVADLKQLCNLCKNAIIFLPKATLSYLFISSFNIKLTTDLTDTV
jgi:hypothetical protein